MEFIKERINRFILEVCKKKEENNEGIIADKMGKIDGD